MVVEPMARETLAENLNPVGRIFYSASVGICTPASVAQEGGMSLGAQTPDSVLRTIALEAGFARFERATETHFNRLRGPPSPEPRGTRAAGRALADGSAAARPWPDCTAPGGRPSSRHRLRRPRSWGTSTRYRGVNGVGRVVHDLRGLGVHGHLAARDGLLGGGHDRVNPGVPGDCAARTPATVRTYNDRVVGASWSDGEGADGDHPLRVRIGRPPRPTLSQAGGEPHRRDSLSGPLPESWRAETQLPDGRHL